MGEKNGKVSNLLEDGWFFGNTLLSCSNSSKSMVRCNSDPCSSSSNNNNKEEALVDSHHQGCPSKMSSSSLFRTPSLPPCWGRDTNNYGFEDEDEEEDEARMGDLIRQAMPMPMPMPLPRPNNMMHMPKRRLDRTPSLPPCRVREGSTNVTSNGGKNDAGVGRLSRRESIDSSILMKEKGPIAEVSNQLTRRASIDSSILLPPKSNTSKGTKQSMSNLKNRPHRKIEPSLATNSQGKHDTKLEKLDKCKSEKSLSDLEVEELQGFKDLGFSFDNQEELSPSVTQILPALQRRASLDSSIHVDNNVGKVRRPYLSESWQKPLYTPPLVPKWSDPKASTSDDMKAQIKFWARAVASNVRQEC